MIFKIPSKLVLKIVNFAVKRVSNLIKMFRLYPVCPYMYQAFDVIFLLLAHFFPIEGYEAPIFVIIFLPYFFFKGPLQSAPRILK